MIYVLIALPKATEGFKYSPKTIQRQLDIAVKTGLVVRPRYGFYSLPVGQELDMVSK